MKKFVSKPSKSVSVILFIQSLICLILGIGIVIFFIIIFDTRDLLEKLFISLFIVALIISLTLVTYLNAVNMFSHKNIFIDEI